MKPAHETGLVGFHVIDPPFSTSQHDAIEWLARAHSKAEERVTQPGSELLHEAFISKMRRSLAQFGCGPDKIHARRHVLKDFTHEDWDSMEIFRLSENPHGLSAGKRAEFSRRSMEEAFDGFYPMDSTEGNGEGPDAIIHVTCTGYSAPSGAQTLVEKRGWGDKTVVSHAYHMGCYAAVPAIRQAAGFLASSSARRVDIAHTELCSLYLDPSVHTPEQLVVQSLFSDGFIKYSVVPMNSESPDHPRGINGLEVLCLYEELVPRSASAMTWSLSDWGLSMTLIREVPAIIERALPRFLERLFAKIGLSYEESQPQLVFAIHPGGPKIIERIQAALELSEFQVAASKQVLFERGNMSSATLPHIWKKIVDDSSLPSETKIVSLAFGPGLTIAGGILAKY